MRKDILQEINNEIKDILNRNFTFEYSKTQSVPNYEDKDFTFERDFLKKGKTIETCVLHIDIRKSTQFNLKYSPEEIGKLYTAFIKTMSWIADEHGGYVRNIIGDRLMVVFPTPNCFINAVDCAISMNTIAHHIIDYHFKKDNFKCGIGIDYGEMTVLKTGIVKRGTERTNYKNLIWLGKPANIASKLTDIANKEISRIYYEITFESKSLFRALANKKPVNYMESKHLTLEEFFKDIDFNGEYIKYKDKIVTKINKQATSEYYPPILMTDKVYNNFVTNSRGSGRNDIEEEFWKYQKTVKIDSAEKVYGGDVFWDSIGLIKK